ncbi:transposase [Streptomyces sp. NBC_00341]|uniref:zinc ribbon domain-containing protein n=1 Tax=Streptomyces sp. NBC_00341 TaxID=2975717 RepID=UPI00308F964B|nr:transposase [Streptomyces sp. NBC_00341]
MGFAESCRALTGWRQASETSWLREVSSTVLQQPLRHLDGAFTRFFKQLTKRPQRKRKHRSRDSATYVRTGFRWAEDPEHVDHPRLLKKYERELRSIIDAAWGELLRQLRYKCAWYGRTLVIVDRFFPSTRRCSGCHAKGPSLDVSVREWTCTECGAAHDRDVNAARNLRAEGMRLYWLVASALPPGRVPPSVIKASEPADVPLAA